MTTRQEAVVLEVEKRGTWVLTRAKDRILARGVEVAPGAAVLVEVVSGSEGEDATIVAAAVEVRKIEAGAPAVGVYGAMNASLRGGPWGSRMGADESTDPELGPTTREPPPPAADPVGEVTRVDRRGAWLRVDGREMLCADAPGTLAVGSRIAFERFSSSEGERAWFVRKIG